MCANTIKKTEFSLRKNERIQKGQLEACNMRQQKTGPKGQTKRSQEGINRTRQGRAPFQKNKENLINNDKRL